MSASLKARLDSIVSHLQQKNSISSLLQKGKEKEQTAKSRQQRDHYELNSHSYQEAENLFNNPIFENEGPSKKMNQEQPKERKMKSILRQDKPDKKSLEKDQGQMIPEDVDKKSKSVSFYEEGRPIYLVPVDKKWSDKVQNQKKGKFQPHEQKALCDAVGQFLASNQIEFEQFKKMISEGSNGILRKQKFFHLLSGVLPERSPESCYKFILRQFHTMNHQGPWTQQEVDRLLALVDKYGRKWKLIAKELNRTSDNVYDKYRSLGQEGLQERIKKLWKIRELVTLLTLIQDQSKVRFVDSKIKRLLENEQQHDKKEQKELSSRKYNTKSFVFHNIEILRPYIDAKLIKSVNLESIKWKKIMKEVPTKSIFDCRNKFVQMLQVFFRDNHTLDDSLVQFLEKQNPTEEAKINWKQWASQDYTPEEARNRLMIMKKLIEGRSVKPFPVIVQEIRNKVNKQMGSQG